MSTTSESRLGIIEASRATTSANSRFGPTLCPFRSSILMIGIPAPHLGLAHSKIALSSSREYRQSDLVRSVTSHQMRRRQRPQWRIGLGAFGQSERTAFAEPTTDRDCPHLDFTQYRRNSGAAARIGNR